MRHMVARIENRVQDEKIFMCNIMPGTAARFFINKEQSEGLMVICTPDDLITKVYSEKFGLNPDGTRGSISKLIAELSLGKDPFEAEVYSTELERNIDMLITHSDKF